MAYRRIASILAWLALGVTFGQPSGIEEVVRALREQRFGAAHGLLQPLLARQPSNARMLALDGMALAGMRQTAASLRQYDRALAVTPDFLPALLGKAEVQYQTSATGAATTLRRVLAIDAENVTAHAMLASLDFARKDCRQAIPHFEKGLARVEQNETAVAQFATCLSLETRYAEAIRLLEPVCARSRPAPYLIRLLARAYEFDHRSAGAIELLKRGVGLYPNEESFYLDLGAVCADFNAFDLGLEVLAAGASRIPSSPAIRMLRGILFVLKGDADRGDAEFAEADRLSPKQMHRALGEAYASMLIGSVDLSRTIQTIRDRLKAQPDDAVLHFVLAEALTRTPADPGNPRFAEAVSHLERSCRLKPDFARAHSALGRMYRKAGRPTESIREFETALRLDPASHVDAYQLANLLKTAGRESEAQALFARVRTLREQDRQAADERTRLELVKVRE